MSVLRLVRGLLALLLATAGPAPAAPETSTMNLLDPKDGDRTWRIVNDGVMGGVSRSRWIVSDEGATFEGIVSGENNGGFASVRTTLAPRDLSEWDGLRLRVSGDGQVYQLRLRTDDAMDGVAYRARFTAPAGEAEDVRVPFSAFQPTWRGRIVTEAPPLDPARVRQLGFLIADGQLGPFRLRVEEIGVYRDHAR